MKLLVVEDDIKIATALKKGLSQEGFAVDMVHDGKKGLSYSRDESYDAIILDRMLPGIDDGTVICQTLRHEKITTPILLLTAKDKIPDRVAGLNEGADDYLVKPFAFDELVARVRALLRRPTETQSPILTLADLTLNPATHEVTRASSSVILSHTEFNLLEFLLRKANQVITKDQLIAHVWNDDADVLPNTVEVYIGYLRAKIDKPFATPLIHTVRGFGYKLSETA